MIFVPSLIAACRLKRDSDVRESFEFAAKIAPVIGA